MIRRSHLSRRPAPTKCSLTRHLCRKYLPEAQGVTTALVEGVEDGAPAGGAAGDQAVRPEHGLGGDEVID